MDETNKSVNNHAGAEIELSVGLAAAIKDYGEACHDYGLGNPMNLAQMNGLYALTQEAWGKVSKILDDLKAAHDAERELKARTAARMRKL